MLIIKRIFSYLSIIIEQVNSYTSISFYINLYLWCKKNFNDSYYD